MDRSAVLAQCRVLASVSGERRAELERMSRASRHVRGQVIFRQDDAVPGMYIVHSGLVRVYKIAPSGKDHTLHLAAPSQTFAEVAAIAGFPCPAWAEAVEDTETLLLPAEPFRQMLARDHGLCLELLSGMGLWVRHLTSLLEDIVLRDAASRVARQLVSAERDASGTVVLPGLRKHLASQLNLTPETLSRTLHRFVEAGLIAVNTDQAVRVLDETRLREASEAG